MGTVETAVTLNPQSQGFSLVDVLTLTHTHTHTHCCLNNHSSLAISRLAETMINDELCDPVLVRERLTFPLILCDILLTSHL